MSAFVRNASLDGDFALQLMIDDSLDNAPAAAPQFADAFVAMMKVVE